MAIPFLRNPISAILGTIRGVTDIAGRLREPLGSAIGKLGRALANIGADVEAAAIRRRVEREAELAKEADRAAGVSRVRLPTDTDIPEATTKLRRKYSYTIRVRQLNAATGQIEERFITLSTDSIIDDANIVTNTRSLIGEGYGVDLDRVTEIETVSIKRAGAAGTL